MNTLPERADADRIHAESGTISPFIHAQRFADGWNACLEYLERFHQPAVAELIEATRSVIGWVPGPVHFHSDEPQKAVERARAAADAIGGAK